MSSVLSWSYLFTVYRCSRLNTSSGFNLAHPYMVICAGIRIHLFIGGLQRHRRDDRTTYGSRGWSQERMRVSDGGGVSPHELQGMEDFRLTRSTSPKLHTCTYMYTIVHVK